ncbi:hypothetical protein JMUB6875_28660 [Nocardia sp. JMUB6875]
MTPGVELGARDPHLDSVFRVGQRERGVACPEPEIQYAEQDVAVADDEFACGITHRGGPVAAAAGLVEHEGAVRIAEATEEIHRRRGGAYPAGHGHQKKPWALGA